MPVLHIRALPQKKPQLIEKALKKTCSAIAKVYGCKPEQVWATWEEIQPGHYVEGDNAVPIQPESSHPPIAQLTCFEGKTSEQIEKVLLAGASTLALELEIPGNVFMTYHEAASGRVVAGNGIIRKQ